MNKYQAQRLINCVDVVEGGGKHLSAQHITIYKFASICSWDEFDNYQVRVLCNKLTKLKRSTSKNTVGDSNVISHVAVDRQATRIARRHETKSYIAL